MDEYILALKEQLDKTAAQIQELVDADEMCVTEINNNSSMPEEEEFKLKMSMTGRFMLAEFLQSHLIFLDNELTSAVQEKLIELDQRNEKLKIAKKELMEYVKSRIFTIADMTHSEFTAFREKGLGLDVLEKELRGIDKEKVELLALLDERTARNC